MLKLWGVTEWEITGVVLSNLLIRRASFKQATAKKSATPEQAEQIDKAQIEKDYKDKKFEDLMIELELEESPKPLGLMDGAVAEISIGGMFEGLFPKRKRKRKLTVKQAREALLEAESDKLIDNDKVNSEAIRRAEESGIIFIDEMDKILDKGHSNLRFHIEGRRKSLISTEKKIIRYLDLGESVDLIHDFFAFRIILFGSDSVGLEEHCYKVMEEIIEFAIKNGFTPCDSLPLIDSKKTNPHNNFYDSFKYKNYIKDYICFPKNNGYRSIHLVLRDKKGRYFEIQIRTLAMHVHAEASAEANHLKYKEQKYMISPLTLDREKISIYGYSYIKGIDNNPEYIFDFAGIEKPVIIFQRHKT